VARTSSTLAGPDAVEQLSPEYAELIWPELPALCDAIVAEVRTVVPAYAQAIDGNFEAPIRAAVHQIVKTFVHRFTAPCSSSPTRDEMCRELGRLNAEFGISFDHLQAAYRLGVRLLWRYVVNIGMRRSMPPTAMSAVADSLFGYMDEIVGLSRQGYLEVLNASPDRRDSHGRHLLRAIVDGASVSPATVSRLAEGFGWTLPQEATIVAFGAGTMPDPSILDDDVLVDVLDNDPHLLVPGPFDAARRAMLERSLVGCRAAVGSTVPLAAACDSLRWARQTLALAERGAIAADKIIYCDDHLFELWLLAAPGLVDRLAARQLAPLDGLTANRRRRLLETLQVWLANRGNALQMAEELGVHPQTVRYRMRTIKQTFGDALEDPDWRAATDIVVRAMRLREPGDEHKAFVDLGDE
jgi:hypothetical protein